MTVRKWDVEVGQELAVLRGHEHTVNRVAFSPDGKRIISASWDNTLRVWDAESGECLEVIRGTGDIAAIAADADHFPWRAISRGQETVLEPTAGGPSIAWFPEAIYSITTHPAAPCWAGGVGSHLYLIQLEGPLPQPSAAPPDETAPSDTLSPETRPT